MAKQSTRATLARRIGGNGPVWAKALRWLVALSVVGFVVGAIVLWLFYRAVDIPEANAEFLTQTTTVYYSDGKHVVGKLSTQDRDSIPLSDMPQSIQDAVIAAEDRSFHTNRGLDFRGILRALRENTSSGEITSGGSTITQQYVKLLFLTQERTYTRKAKEAVLALKIHNKLSKDEILEGYLNTIYFGNGAYGIEVAAETYFDKPAKELTIAESAALASIINIPSYYDPYVEGGKERLINRYHYVLDGMEKAGTVSEDEYAKIYDKLPAFAERTVSQRYGGSRGFLLKMVENEMAELQFSASQVNGAGYKIITTFDYRRQKAAVEEIRKQGPSPWPSQLHRALVSIEPGRGAVRALYGGPDFLKSQINWATVGTQPGSTFKVFTLAAALDDGFSLKTRLNGNSPIYIQGKPVENQGDSGGKPYGIINLTKATQFSVNTAFLDMQRQLGDDNYEAGAQKVLEMANKLGVPTSTTEGISKVPVTTLGFAPVAPIDMANSYATLAAGGEKAEWYVVEKVTKDGTELHKHEVKTERVIPEKVAGDALVALKAVVQGGTGKSAATRCPTVGKTGTATFGSGQSQHVSSSWFVGTTPRLTTAVMQNVGKNGNGDVEAVLPGAYFGGKYPAQTFQAYMARALGNTDCGKFPPPGNIKGDKGKTLAPPTATLKCPDGYDLKGDKCYKQPGSTAECQQKDPNSIYRDGACVPVTCSEGRHLEGENCVPDETTPPPVTCWDGSTAATEQECPSRPPANSLKNKDDCEFYQYTWVPGLTPGSGKCE